MTAKCILRSLIFGKVCIGYLEADFHIEHIYKHTGYIFQVLVVVRDSVNHFQMFVYHHTFYTVSLVIIQNTTWPANPHISAWILSSWSICNPPNHMKSVHDVGRCVRCFPIESLRHVHKASGVTCQLIWSELIFLLSIYHYCLLSSAFRSWVNMRMKYTSVTLVLIE
jgi:hypothetical protein